MKEYLTQKELCKWLKISPVTLWRWRRAGLPYFKYGNTVRFNPEEVSEWLEQNEEEEDE
ncbi:MAG: helix-turn-helix domain-containing protein [Peptococcaceae bacterium]|jgi:excisionase family DNA binding protein|nr:helix-turn-helix domain-containing protein [Peptococcaceae bacterium]